MWAVVVVIVGLVCPYLVWRIIVARRNIGYRPDDETKGKQGDPGMDQLFYGIKGWTCERNIKRKHPIYGIWMKINCIIHSDMVLWLSLNSIFMRGRTNILNVREIVLLFFKDIDLICNCMYPNYSAMIFHQANCDTALG